MPFGPPLLTYSSTAPKVQLGVLIMQQQHKPVGADSWAHTCRPCSPTSRAPGRCSWSATAATGQARSCLSGVGPQVGADNSGLAESAAWGAADEAIPVQPNRRLLVNYGFVDEANPYDRLAVTATLQTSDPLYQLKRSLLQRHGLASQQTFQLGA